MAIGMPRISRLGMSAATEVALAAAPGCGWGRIMRAVGKCKPRARIIDAARGWGGRPGAYGGAHAWPRRGAAARVRRAPSADRAGIRSVRPARDRDAAGARSHGRRA